VDIEGVTHKVDVTAESLNEAVGMAIAVFRKEEWASMLPEMSTAQIEVQQPTVEHTVNLQAWWKWRRATRRDPQKAHPRIAEVTSLVVAISLAGLDWNELQRHTNDFGALALVNHGSSTFVEQLSKGAMPRHSHTADIS
jgi:hypothetical protein